MIITASILLFMWLLGTLVGLTFGGYIHILLGVSVALFLYRFIKGGGEETSFD